MLKDSILIFLHNYNDSVSIKTVQQKIQFLLKKMMFFVLDPVCRLIIGFNYLLATVCVFFARTFDVITFTQV